MIFCEAYVMLFQPGQKGNALISCLSPAVIGFVLVRGSDLKSSGLTKAVAVKQKLDSLTNL